MSLSLYLQKFVQLMADRPLSMEEESERAAELTDVWYALTPEEQEEVEREVEVYKTIFAHDKVTPEAPEDLGLTDRPTADGITPRY